VGKLINIDNGGTLTDIWVLDGDRSVHTKTVTTPYDLSKCLIEGLKKVSRLFYGEENLAALIQSTDHIRYSTTQGTNALVQKKGTPLGLILATETDLSRLQVTPEQKAMFGSLLGERTAVMDLTLQGDAYTQAVVEAINRLSSGGAQRIVVSFDTTDAKASEARFKHIALRLFPRHLLGAIPVLYATSLTSDNDYARRTWTSLYNAFLHPTMERFLFNAENLLRPYRPRNPLLIYRNDGYSGRVAKTIALRTYSSGPRGGMESARAYADYYGHARLLTMDVGGTTTDIGIIEDGVVRHDPKGAIERVATSQPLSDVISIGVGGGSIFRVIDGAIRVGPDSVGGAPGPACFGLGGQEATITDALLLLGVLDPKTYFGGDMKLDAGRARSALQSKIAGPLGCSIEQAAQRMLAAWAKQIARGLAEFAHITPDTVLGAFGGGGPMGACAVAESAGIGTVLIPRLSAVFCAHGIGFSDIAHQRDVRIDDATDEKLTHALAELKVGLARDMFSEGFDSVDCRWLARVEVGAGETALDLAAPTLPIEYMGKDITLHLRAVKPIHHAALPVLQQHASQPASHAAMRTLHGADGGSELLPVIRTEDQPPGASGLGPAIIEEAFWTCHVLPGWRYDFTSNGDVVLKKL
jgi:N-methylhydantoinase A